MIRLAIVEDDADLRRELVSQLGSQPDLMVVKEFPDAETATIGLPGLSVDVVLTDIQLPGNSGIELVRRMKRRMSGTDFLMLTTFNDDDLVFEALRAGAIGYLLKRNQPLEVAAAIRNIGDGGSPMSSSIARKVVGAFRSPDHDDYEPLSPRERELIDLLARGRTYKECATSLDLSVDTVRTYIRRIYQKLHVHSRHEAVEKAGKSLRSKDR
jgi:DNA-binding NarL/FixJ family response regulator